MRAGWQPWASVMGTNLAIAIVVGLLVTLVGWQAFLLIQAPITLLAGAIGIWLFYVQHQFERTYWAHDATWDSRDGALHGSRTTTCRPSCAGSRPISACTTSTTSRAASPATGSPRR